MNVFDRIGERLSKKSIPPRILLSKFRFIQEESRSSHESLDPSYMPFYYYLGHEFQPKSVCTLELGLGLPLGCLLAGCKPERVMAFQEKRSEFYSDRLAKANIKSVYRGNLDIHYGELEMKEKWQCILLDGNHNQTLFNLAWDSLEDDGILCIDHIEKCSQAFQNLYILKRREPVFFPTRYGVGIIQK